MQEEKAGFITPSGDGGDVTANSVGFVPVDVVQKHVETRGWFSRLVPFKSELKLMPLHLVAPSGACAC